MRRHTSLHQRILVVLAIASALVASTALAAPKAVSMMLNTLNTANALTTLTANLAGPVLRISNTNDGPALALDVPAAQAPIEISAGAGKVANLDADKLDGHDASDFAQGLYVRHYHPGRILASKGVVDVVQGGNGHIYVTFDRDVSSCAYIATPGMRNTTLMAWPLDGPDGAYTIDVYAEYLGTPEGHVNFSLAVVC